MRLFQADIGCLHRGSYFIRSTTQTCTHLSKGVGMYCKEGYEKVILLIFYIQLCSKPMVSIFYFALFICAKRKKRRVKPPQSLAKVAPLRSWNNLSYCQWDYLPYLVILFFLSCPPDFPCGSVTVGLILLRSCVALIIAFLSTCIHQLHPQSNQQSEWMRTLMRGPTAHRFTHDFSAQIPFRKAVNPRMLMSDCSLRLQQSISFFKSIIKLFDWDIISLTFPFFMGSNYRLSLTRYKLRTRKACICVPIVKLGRVSNFQGEAIHPDCAIISQHLRAREICSQTRRSEAQNRSDHSGGFRCDVLHWSLET